MINISLPNFTEYLHINNFFIELYENEKKYFKSDKINFSYMHGSFPFCYWNGNLNSNQGQICLYDNFLYYINMSRAPIRLDFSNICLEENDFYDCMANTILKLAENGSTIIEIANKKLLEYIMENYKFYNHFVIAENFFLLEPDEETIRFINESDNIKLIQIPSNYNYRSIHSLDQFKKSKIELEINPICDLNCSNYQNCMMVNNAAQYKYSTVCSQNGCNRTNNYLDNKYLLTLEDLEMYHRQGINNFYISENHSLNINEYGDFLMNYFIKDEFKQEVLSLWNKQV